MGYETAPGLYGAGVILHYHTQLCVASQDITPGKAGIVSDQIDGHWHINIAVATVADGDVFTVMASVQGNIGAVQFTKYHINHFFVVNTAHHRRGNHLAF